MRRRATALRLRPYEKRAINSVLAEWAHGRRSTMIVAPTGSGKTVMFCKVAERRRPRGRILVLADRQDIVEQANDSVGGLTSLSSQIEMGEQKINLRAPPDVVCASVQSMYNRLDTFDPKLFATVVFDEADLSLAPTYRKVLAHFGDAKLLGVTATPDRGDGQALSQLYESEAIRITYGELSPRYLSRIRQQSVKVLELKLVKRGHGGDFDERALGKVLSEEKPLHEVVTATRKLAGDRPTLVFAATVDHARQLAALFNRYKKGSARAIDGEMGRDERQSIIDPFERGKFQFLCNCALLTRGIDLPLISCISMARPTTSRPLYAQMVGRGTRLHRGKRDLLVLDFVDNSLRNSLVENVKITDGKKSAPGSDDEEPKSAKAPTRTVSILDTLFSEEPPEVRLFAGKLLEELPGSDVAEIIARVKRQFAADATLRARVLAEVKRLQIRDVGMGINWVNQPWADETDIAMSRRLGVSDSTVRTHRPANIPSPWRTAISEALRKRYAAMTPEQRSEEARKRVAATTPERRSEAMRKRHAATTPEQRSETARKANAARTPEQRSEAARKANAAMTPEQRSEAARKRAAARTPEQRSEAMRKRHAAMTPEQRSEMARKRAATMKAARESANTV